MSKWCVIRHTILYVLFLINLSMLVRQAKNTFIRFFEDKGYITNQMTRHDRLYNETGADFLKEISRKPKDIEAINEIVYNSVKPYMNKRG